MSISLAGFLKNISIRKRLMILLCTSSVTIVGASGYIAYKAYEDKTRVANYFEGYKQADALVDASSKLSAAKSLFTLNGSIAVYKDDIDGLLAELENRQVDGAFLQHHLEGLKLASEELLSDEKIDNASQQFISFTKFDQAIRDALKDVKKNSGLSYNANTFQSDLVELSSFTFPHILDDISSLLFQINMTEDSNHEEAARYIEQKLDLANSTFSKMEAWLKTRPEIGDENLQLFKAQFESISDKTYDYIFDAEKMEDPIGTYKELTGAFKKLEAEVQMLTEELITSDVNKYSTMFYATIFAMILIVSVIIIFSLLINRSITSPTQNMQQLITKITETCDFSMRAEQFGNNELGHMGNAVNDLLETLQKAFADINDSISAVSEGDLQKTVKMKSAGDVGKLVNGVNASISNVQSAFVDINNQMKMLQEGNFSEKIDTELPGEFGKVVDTVAETKESIAGLIKETITALESLADGSLNQRVNTPASGEMETLKTNVNESIDQVAKAIDAIQEMAQHLQEKDMTHRITIKQEGKFEDINNGLNKSVEAIEEALNAVTVAAKELNDEANQVVQNQQNIAEHIGNQAASIEETSASMEEMTQTVKNNADNSDVAKNLSQNARDVTESSLGIMSKTTSAMQGIEDMSKKVHDIINVIDEIAFQTNLLALNANVEAARAGEHGRGFAVVAGEVRSLAQKSAEQAKEIKELVESSVKQTKEGSELVTETSSALNQIEETIKQTTDIVNEISAASKEQSLGIEQVHKAVKTMDLSTQQNSTRVEESQNVAESMKSKASKLLENMNTFNIKGAE